MKISKKQLITVVLHAIVWAIFASIPMLILPEPSSLGYDKLLPPGKFIKAGFLLLVLLFYGNLYVLIPKLWQRYSWVHYLIGSSIVFFIAIIIQVQFRQNIISGFNFTGVFELFFKRSSIIGITAIHLLIWMASTGLWLLKEWRKSEEQLKESEQKRVEVELNHLKKQLNPHFLFNTLNSIYALTLTQDKLAPMAVLKLSKLMSYMLNEANGQWIELHKEMEHLNDFIELNRMRLPDESLIELEQNGNFERHQIAPLLLLPFVENAFKYGTSNVEPSPVEIKIEMNENQLHFYCRNKIISTVEATTQSSGVGIPNVKKRLELIYVNKHLLSIKEDAGFFVVDLRIQLSTNLIPSKSQTVSL